MPTLLAGCIGGEPAGEALVRELTAAGVRPALRVAPDAATATIVSLVEPGGQRSMLADRGANLALRPADLPPLPAGGHLYLSGYTLLGDGPRAAGAAARALAARHAMVAVSLGADGALWASADLLVHRPAHPTTVVDTTGAGDAFAAGLLSAWLPDRRIDPTAALDAGLALAADVVRRPGAR